MMPAAMNRTMVLQAASMPHLVFTALLAVVFSGLIALLGHRSRRDRLYHAGYLFACCMATVVAGSWFMYFVHG
ncbi:MAG TPA: hypothetical protein VHY84_17740 [Bryobacteraceae bacterium]|jgi:uncharacterized membrane protein YfcA|nr:hypothetical protein [Bryobacteraceae bacterium]